VFFLLKLLVLPIWLPLKIIGELIEHSGRGHNRRSYNGQTRSNGTGCLAAIAVIVVLAGIGAIAGACSSTSQPAGNTSSAGVTPAASNSPSPSPSPSTVAHRARHHARHHIPRRHHHHARVVPVATQSAPPSATSCYPLSNEGTCYEPGEFCRNSDHGASGLAGDGEKIMCEDNDGWRWEPV
jgi:hypothetical protein